MLAKVKSEDEGTYDIVQPSDYMVESMIKQEMLEKLDQKALTNLSISVTSIWIQAMIRAMYILYRIRAAWRRSVSTRIR